MARALLARLLEFSAGGPFRAHPPRAPRALPDAVAVLSPGALPSTDIYLRARAEADVAHVWQWIDTLAVAPECGPDAVCTLIIVRYLPRAWLRWASERASAGWPVVWLLDDDLPAILRAKELPLDYAWRSAWRFAQLRSIIDRFRPEWWVSTPELQRRYAAATPRLCEPLYVAGSFERSPPESVYFYHGTRSHQREIEWLVPVVRALQEEEPGYVFELAGGPAAGRSYRGIPRVRLLSPTSWPDYLARSSRASYAIGLAPMCDTSFNRARSHSKVFDITRLSAAGVYARDSAAGRIAAESGIGVVCGDSVDEWISAILRLMRDEAARESMCRAAARWCEGRRHAPLPYPVGTVAASDRSRVPSS